MLPEINNLKIGKVHSTVKLIMLLSGVGTYTICIVLLFTIKYNVRNKSIARGQDNIKSEI